MDAKQATLTSGDITTALLASQCVTTTKLPDSVITAGKIAANQVTAAKLDSNCVTTAKIVNDAVTEDKLADSINSAIAANTNKVTYPGSANATELNILDGATLTTTELNYVDGVTSSIQTQIDAKAPLANAQLTGNPTAPTQSSGDNSTKIATTAYVDTASGGVSVSADNTWTGKQTFNKFPVVPTPVPIDMNDYNSSSARRALTVSDGPWVISWQSNNLASDQYFTLPHLNLYVGYSIKITAMTMFNDSVEVKVFVPENSTCDNAGVRRQRIIRAYQIPDDNGTTLKRGGTVKYTFIGDLGQNAGNHVIPNSDRGITYHTASDYTINSTVTYHDLWIEEFDNT